MSTLTLWVAEISEPGTGVELGVGSLNLALCVDYKDVNTLNLLGVIGRAVDRDPTPADLVAAVEDTKGLKVERGPNDRDGDEKRSV
jgi:hypothetical protein